MRFCITFEAQFESLKIASVCKILGPPVTTRKLIEQKNRVTWNSLSVQWLRHCAFTAEGPGLIPGQGTKIPQAAPHSQKKKKNGVTNFLILMIKK